MKKVIHKVDFRIRPMLIVGDVERVTKYIWETSKSVPDEIKRELEIWNHGLCYLDPGGYYYLKGPHKKFEIDDVEFDIQLSKVEDVLVYMRTAEERIPGYMRFPMWRDFIILPKETFDKLKLYLQELEKSDACIHAELEERDVLDKAIRNDKGLYRHAGNILRYIREKFKK
jgi:hypothetical protein